MHTPCAKTVRLYAAFGKTHSISCSCCAFLPIKMNPVSESKSSCSRTLHQRVTQHINPYRHNKDNSSKTYTNSPMTGTHSFLLSIHPFFSHWQHRLHRFGIKVFLIGQSSSEEAPNFVFLAEINSSNTFTFSHREPHLSCFALRSKHTHVYLRKCISSQLSLLCQACHRALEMWYYNKYNYISNIMLYFVYHLDLKEY